MQERYGVFVVLGMHRSGTSAMTRALQVLGISTGESLIPLGADNPKGFFEDAHVNALNIAMMRYLGQEWDSIAPFSESDATVLKGEGFASTALALLTDRLAKYPMFALKDPRIAKLMPFWSSIFDSLDSETYYILMFRNPRSVKDSLMTRNGLLGEQSYLMWLQYIITSLLYTSGHNRLLVNYDDLIDAPAQVLNRIAEQLGLTVNQQELHIFERQFLETSLRHTVYDSTELLQDEDAPRLVSDVFESLLSINASQGTLDDSSFLKEVEDWDLRLSELGPALRLANHFETNARQKDIELNRLGVLATELSTQIELLKTALERASDLEMRTHDLEQRISQLLDSTSWRLTAPLRRTSDVLKRRSTSG